MQPRNNKQKQIYNKYLLSKYSMTLASIFFYLPNWLKIELKQRGIFMASIYFSFI